MPGLGQNGPQAVFRQGHQAVGLTFTVNTLSLDWIADRLFRDMKDHDPTVGMVDQAELIWPGPRNILPACLSQGRLMPNPDADFVLLPDDRVAIIGGEDAVQQEHDSVDNGIPQRFALAQLQPDKVEAPDFE